MLCRALFFSALMMFATAAHADPADYTELMKVDAKGSNDSVFTGRYEGSTRGAFDVAIQI